MRISHGQTTAQIQDNLHAISRRQSFKKYILQLIPNKSLKSTAVCNDV